ncbi:MAG: alkyl hydroperoxide reductase subunit F [Deltaproteobacteria bacterium]|nr:alkyl hydroperoxide reductase subunit F [Deltaproteobacteria bacterium]
MLDSAIRDQLTPLMAQLQVPVIIDVMTSDHEQQGELRALLGEIASLSGQIQVTVLSETAAVPTFTVRRQDQAARLAFRGIPNGHEFTSLVLAVLNAGGVGKMPDDGLAARIRRLRSDLAIKTYVSLSCENCPEVVQALNRIALVHGALSHTMIDGGVVPEEISARGIQGVPAVYVGDELLHSGRASLAELLSKLEAQFPSAMPITAQSLGHYDVAVIGGGPAGASAAIYSARKGLKTILVAERLGGQVQDTKGIENMISVLYTEGPQLSAQVEQHLRSYPVQILEHRRVSRITAATTRELTLDSGESLTCDALIVATGAKWRELNVPGEKEYLGRGVAFCPHCDGPFYRGKKVAVIGGGNSGVEAAIDLAGIANEVVLLEYAASLKADQILIDKLKSLPNAQVITSAKTTGIIGDGQRVTELAYTDLRTQQHHDLRLDGVFVQIGLLPNSAPVKDVVATNKYGEIIVDEKGRTSARGVYAAGDVTTIPFKQIVIAMGDGAKVALAAFEDRLRQQVGP